MLAHARQSLLKPHYIRQWVVRDAVHIDLLHRDLVRCLRANAQTDFPTASYALLQRLLRRGLNEHATHTTYLHNRHELRCSGNVVALVQMRMFAPGLL
jgi:23S rRNA maturation mini-RNase III